MPIPTPQPVAEEKVERISLMEWLKGLQSYLDDDRKDANGLKTSANVVIEQNGTIRPRPSMIEYGTQPTGTVLGQIYPFVKLNGATPENWEICVMNVSGTAKVYTRKDGGTWTVRNGKTYNTTARCFFEQIDESVVISNGVDNLSYFDIPTDTVIPFVSLSTPSIVSVVATGIAGTNFKYYYRVTAINQGETAGATAVSVDVTKVRDQWLGGTSEFVTVTWGRVTNATRYNIYVGDQSGFEYYLDTVGDIGSGANQTYKDDGSVALNTNRLAPNGDSTAGPKVTRTTNVAGQLFMVGDADNPYRIWFGGTSLGAALNFSAFDGGGWVEIAHGGRELPVKIVSFRDGHGNPVATCFMKGTSGKGKLVHLAMTSTTVGETVITYAQIQEANGQDGTDAPDGVIYARDRLHYPSRDGFKTTGTKPQIQNILSTDNTSDAILDDIKRLNVKNMSKCVGLEFEGRLYWALPVGDTSNNQIWAMDLNREGLWTNPWYIDADWMWLYDDNDGATHFMVLSGNKIYEFGYGQLTQDGTTAFSTNMGSGNIKFSKDGMEWGSVLDVTFVFLRPQGEIPVSVIGKTEDNPVSTVGSQTFVPESTPAGWNEAAWDHHKYPWDAVVNTPEVFGSAREEVTIEIGEEMKWLRWEVNTIAKGVDFQLADVVIRYVNVGVIDKD